jgi:hypothetical protein
MSIFSSANEIFDRCLHNKNLYSIQLSFKQFHQALKYHCKDWIHHYGQHLYIKMSNKLKEINEILNNLSQGLHHDADTVPDLKFVLNIIDEINQQQESIEHSINDIEQSYRILHQHHFECPQSEWVLIQTLSPRLIFLRQPQLIFALYSEVQLDESISYPMDSSVSHCADRNTDEVHFVVS